MKKKSITFLILTALLTSCISEKNASSPLSNTFSGGDSGASSSEKVFGRFKFNTNAAEISNLISTFPVFNNKKVDNEVFNLKMHLTNYLHAVEAFNVRGKIRNLQEVEISYKNLQRLRKKLNADEDEILNRYLVRIKTNISVLESEAAQNGF